MANKFSEHFANNGQTLANKLQCVDGDHLEFVNNISGDSMFIMLTE